MDNKKLVQDCINILTSGKKDYNDVDRHTFIVLYNTYKDMIDSTLVHLDFKHKNHKIVITNRKELHLFLETLLNYL